MLQSRSNGVCSTRLEVPTTTTTNTKEIKTVSTSTSNDIFADIVGYSIIKREFAKALKSTSPVGILLVGQTGCGKSEFLKQIRKAYDDKSVFIDGSYGSKAGIFEALRAKKPKYVLLDEIDKLTTHDQQALLNLMESGRLTKTTKLESYDIKLDVWVFATANHKEELLEPLYDRFEVYFLTAYTGDEFIAIATRRLKQEGIENEELALYVANSVLRALGRKSLRETIRIARKSNTMEDIDETILALKKYDLK
ncbi:MAG: AAA family ATPase [Thermoproteota archaeon]|nr:AAA family ATPase [Thermoproteota archaeon]